MNSKLLEEKVGIQVKRSVAMDAKIQAILKGMTREEYIEFLVEKDKIITRGKKNEPKF